jgi:hypothetical protein
MTLSIQILSVKILCIASLYIVFFASTAQSQQSALSTNSDVFSWKKQTSGGLINAVGRINLFITGGIALSLMPNGVEIPTYPSYKTHLGLLNDFSWGWRGWIGRVMIGQDLCSSPSQLKVPENDSSRLQSGKRVVFTLGYTAFEDSWFRLTPFIESGTQGIVVMDISPNPYIQIGGGVDITQLIPIGRTMNWETNNPNDIITWLGMLSFRASYVANYSDRLRTWSDGMLSLRLVLGVGIQRKIEKIEINDTP